MLDISTSPPSAHGNDFSDPATVRNTFVETWNWIREIAETVRREGNNPKYIVLDGGRTLYEAMRNDRFKSGDLIATVSTKASALRRSGWVFCNGRNGTPDSIDAFAIGGAVAADPGLEVVGSSSVTSGGPTPTDTANAVATIPVAKTDGCGDNDRLVNTTHNHDMNSHTHGVAVIAGVKSFTVVWMMKL